MNLIIRRRLDAQHFTYMFTIIILISFM